jgi:hypothetical protein
MWSWIMSAVLESLLSGIDYDLQTQVRYRVSAMQRHLNYLFETDGPVAVGLPRQVWTYERLEIFCELNAFYQVILGPLASSARASANQPLGNDIPIRYGGAITFDAERAGRVKGTVADFMRRMRKLGVPQAALTAARADDLLRAIRAIETGEEEDTTSDDFPF